jgi:SAM-dependent methyltransferase
MVEDDRKKMETIMKDHKLSERELHNIFQRITWDASADAKAIQADIVGNAMKPELQERITKACEIAVQATQSEFALGKVLDVGCGHGAIVKSLVDAGLSEPDMYMGIDLSQIMVKNAIDRYGSARNGRTGKGRHFVAGDFLTHDFGAGGMFVFDSVIFCSALHDLPDMEASIGKAASLLRSNGGKLVIVHAQGAHHVLGQHRANPVMVKRGLPTSKEWVEMLEKHNEWGIALEYGPADPESAQDMKEGYLAVLTKDSDR